MSVRTATCARSRRARSTGPTYPEFAKMQALLRARLRPQRPYAACVLVAGANQRAAGATARDRLSICETLLRSAGDMCVVVSICFGPTPGIVSSRLLVAFVPIVLVGTNRMFGRITPRE